MLQSEFEPANLKCEQSPNHASAGPSSGIVGHFPYTQKLAYVNCQSDVEIVAASYEKKETQKYFFQIDVKWA